MSPINAYHPCCVGDFGQESYHMHCHIYSTAELESWLLQVRQAYMSTRMSEGFRDMRAYILAIITLVSDNI